MRPSFETAAMLKEMSRLEEVDAFLARRYPGESARRQAVHTVYGGAHLFRFDTAARLGRLARQALEEYAPDFTTFARVLSLAGAELLPPAGKAAAALAALAASDPQRLERENRAAWFAHAVYERTMRKLEREPVEDFRIDFEDGYGIRPDAEEDRHAESAAAEVARGLAAGTLPPFIGIRIKPLSAALRARSVRTLDIFLSALAAEMHGKLPEHFVITLPKIVAAEQVAALVAILEALESRLGLGRGALRLELMIETPQALISARGDSNLPRFLEAAAGRCSAAHFGPYDYLSACGIAASEQRLGHPACDFARHMMLVAFAGTGVAIADSCTITLPVPPHRVPASGRLSAAQHAENRAVVHRAWKLHFDDARHSLREGFYQGWDVHPAQLPTRYAAVYSFFLEALDASADRLRNFLGKAAQATRVGDIFDDAATGQGLLNFFLRAVNSGALSEQEAAERSGLAAEELRSGSLVQILKARLA